MTISQAQRDALWGNLGGPIKSDECATADENQLHCPEPAHYRIIKDGKSFTLCVRCMANYAHIELQRALRK